MAYPARVYRVLIASPSDVTEERDIAVRVIQEWNDLNSPERQIVLLPLRWETHSAPEYGKRPQEVINRQIVDRCDLLIGMFWTRVGSPTGVADSGTLEEIDRVAKEGKPVMLYFSEVKQNPKEIDLEQLARLREFRTRTYPKALVESYSNVVEFRDKLAKQIEIQLRSLVADDSEGSNPNSAGPLTDIQLHFADSKTGAPMGDTAQIDSIFLTLSDFSQLPDYKVPEQPSPPGSELLRFSSKNANSNYYREKATFAIQRALFRPVRFWLKNNGQIGARDVYIDLTVSAKEGKIICLPKGSIPGSPPTKTRDLFYPSETHAGNPEEFLSKGESSWATYFEIPALQPKREFSPEPNFFVGLDRSQTVEFVAKIYADTLPEPVIRKLTIEFKVKQITLPAAEILDDLPVAEPVFERATPGPQDSAPPKGVSKPKAPPARKPDASAA